MAKGDVGLQRIKEAADKAEAAQGAAVVADPQIQKMIKVVEAFLRAKHRICYGGFAINALLSKAKRFYNEETDLPDYDFLSPDALGDGMELAEVYKQQLGYQNVELRQGVHHGTFKLFVEFTPIADISETPQKMYNFLLTEAIEVDGIKIAHPDYLRASMYLELSRPAGDTSRWPKVYQRLQLLNAAHPLKMPKGVCPPGGPKALVPVASAAAKTTATEAATIHSILIPHIAEKGYVMLGAHTLLFYIDWNTPGSKVLAELKEREAAYIIMSNTHVETAEEIATLLRTKFGAAAVTIKPHPRLGELIPPHHEVQVAGQHTCFVYQTIACHAYYPMKVGPRMILRVASMDTILSLYMAFMLSERKYYERTTLLCMAQYLIDRVAQLRSMGKPPMPVISLDCLGHQPTLIDLKKEYSARVMAATEAGKGKGHLAEDALPLAVFRPLSLTNQKISKSVRPEDLFRGGRTRKLRQSKLRRSKTRRSKTRRSKTRSRTRKNE